MVETKQHTSRVIGDWIQFYNHRRPHQVLSMKIPPKRMLYRPDLCRNRWVITSLRSPGDARTKVDGRSTALPVAERGQVNAGLGGLDAACSTDVLERFGQLDEVGCLKFCQYVPAAIGVKQGRYEGETE